jgi:hypothetical protein
MKKILALCLLCLTGFLAFSQNIYQWKSEKIGISSPVVLKEYSTSSAILLEGNGFKIEIGKLEGMEGISGLEASLESYASSFYKNAGKVQSFNELKNLKAATIEAQKDGKPVLICLFSTVDYTKHFICEISFIENLRKSAVSILNSISYNEKVSNISNDISVDNPSENINENTHISGTELEKTTWKLLSKYCPDGYTILDEYYKSPSSYQGQSISGDSDFTKWIDGTRENDVIKSLNTVVHEMCHGYTGKLYLKGLKDAGLSIDGDYSAYYLGNKEMKLVKHTKVFITKEINSIFPEKLKTSRYETYVYPSEAIMGSQQSGIYGLLDELNAYYQGTKTTLDLYNYYFEYQNNVNGWLQFFTDFYGTYYAYLEFKGYMIIYMLYAEKNYKELYSQTLSNKDFLYAFKKTDENWRKLITDFIGIKKKIITNLGQEGLETSESSGFITINGQGVGNFAETYNLFQTELKDAKYQRIAEAMGLESAYGPELGL